MTASSFTVPHSHSDSHFENPLVEVSQASVHFGTQTALDKVSLIIKRHEHLVIRGSNGSGKSTLLRLLRGEQWLDQIRLADGRIGTQGNVRWMSQSGWDDSPVTGKAMSALVSAAWQERIIRSGWQIRGYDFLLGGLNDTIFLSREDFPDQVEQVRATAKMLGAEGLLNTFVSTLSQGQLRLLLVARAALRRPALLLLDEVTEGLDSAARERLLYALDQLSSDSTLVMTTHRPQTLPNWIKHTVEMDHGKIIPTIAHKSQHHVSPESIFESTCAPASFQATSGVGIRLEKVSVYLDGTPVLHNLDWEIHPRENWLVLGENGSGKSTLLRLLAGDEQAAVGGRLCYLLPDQANFVQHPNLEALRKAIHLVSDQQQTLYTWDLYGEELVFSGFDNTVGRFRDASSTEKERVADLLRLAEAENLAHRRMRTCSSGEVRRLLLARALAGTPSLLLLDEPFSGLDAENRENFQNVLNDLAEKGLQMILVTHHSSDILPCINHVLYLEHGKRKES